MITFFLLLPQTFIIFCFYLINGFNARIGVSLCIINSVWYLSPLQFSMRVSKHEFQISIDSSGATTKNIFLKHLPKCEYDSFYKFFTNIFFFISLWILNTIVLVLFLGKKEKNMIEFLCCCFCRFLWLHKQRANSMCDEKFLVKLCEEFFFCLLSGKLYKNLIRKKHYFFIVISLIWFRIYLHHISNHYWIFQL